MVYWAALAFIAGGMLGFLAACLLQAASRADSLTERQPAAAGKDRWE
ncbi:MAG: hypothetical protein QHH27_01000 [Clostridia bacterium]|jgi:uncharacterized protein involved in exopolysaccharide biosynthesis|nr:hypothetical protein [Clostridia bacterium]MDH7572126.1 hypothetical protein [Clostridia bacterium]